MEDKIQHNWQGDDGAELNKLIATLRYEGVEKGESEKKEIIEGAQQKADSIIENAKLEAEKLLKNAKQQIEEENKRMHSQMQLAMRDFLLHAKSELEQLITLKPFQETTANAMSDIGFIKQLIESISLQYLQALGKTASEQMSVEVPESMKIQLEKELFAQIKENLPKNIEIIGKKGVAGLKFKSEKEGATLVVDSNSLTNALLPYISERFHKLLDNSNA